MWGMGGGIGGWTGADDRQSMAVLQAAVDAGVTFFDSAQVYGYGHTDRLLGELVRANPGRELFVASKVPPQEPPVAGPPRRPDPRRLPAGPRAGIRGGDPPPDAGGHDRPACSSTSGRTPGPTIAGWQRAVEELRRDGRVRHVGISVNRREPANVLRTLRTGLIDAVQVVYNVFDQAPEDELFPLCRELGVAVIARVPLDEGSLAGTLTLDSRWPDGDWRNTYFGPAAWRRRSRGWRRSGRSCPRARRWPSWPCASSSRTRT